MHSYGYLISTENLVSFKIEIRFDIDLNHLYDEIDDNH